MAVLHNGIAEVGIVKPHPRLIIRYSRRGEAVELFWYCVSKRSLITARSERGLRCVCLPVSSGGEKAINHFSLLFFL